MSFIKDHIISWAIELTIMLLIAYFTIAEVRKTGEQTRAMLTKYDAAISKFAVSKAKSADKVLLNAKDKMNKAAKELWPKWKGE